MNRVDEKEEKRKRIRDRISVVLNGLLVIFTGIGSFITFTDQSVGTGLKAYGLQNLKFFTVLSNVFCGGIALVWLLWHRQKKAFPVILKLMAASAVGLTFLIVIAFLRPMYPQLQLYVNGNLWFHLIVPVTGMAEFLLLSQEEVLPFKTTLLSGLPVLVYGVCYLGNIYVNGIGIWPDTNDWYGFLKWGYPAGFLIFAVSILLEWGIALLLAFLRHCLSGQRGQGMN
jgi:hypothetical protein